jgi:hypothetical protein
MCASARNHPPATAAKKRKLEEAEDMPIKEETAEPMKKKKKKIRKGQGLLGYFEPESKRERVSVDHCTIKDVWVDGEDKVQVVTPNDAMLVLFERVHASMRKLPEVEGYEEAVALIEECPLSKASWYPHQSRFGPTLRKILTSGATGVRGYSFAGKKSPACDFSTIDGMGELSTAVGEVFGVTFKMAHCNKYDTTLKAQLDWHSDDEKDIVKGGPIVCVSFGAPQRIQIGKVVVDGKPGIVKLYEHVTAHNSIYVMAGPTFQERFQHKAATCTKKQTFAARRQEFTTRISVTFRQTDEE